MSAKHVFSILTIIFSFCLAPNAFAGVDDSVCPKVESIAPGFYDPNLKLSDVMYQFQDHLNAADEAVRLGRSGASVSDQDLQAAADHVLSAENCARVAARNIGFSMIPPRLEKLDPEQRVSYIAGFQKSMTGFAQLLNHYASLFLAVRQTPVAERKFDELNDCKMDIDALATESHSKF